MGSGSVTQEREHRVDDAVWVVQVKSLADLDKDGLVRVLLGNFTTDGGRDGEVGEEGSEGKRLDEDHGEDVLW